MRILYLLLREGAEWILSSRPSCGGHGPRRDPGGSAAEADRPSRFAVCIFELPHGSGGEHRARAPKAGVTSRAPKA